MPENAIGPYQLLGQLGAGGMGVVHRALDPRVGRQVALKVLPESLADDPDRRRRFEQEARVAAALNHPNVMAIYDVGLDHHPPYLVAELVPGESLRAVVSKGPLPPRKAADIAAQIAAGLAAAHAAGIVHRDLKPENVMVTAEGTAKILDFGIARMEPKSTPAVDATVTVGGTAVGAVIGTAAYMSPEQARGEPLDHRSDQFSLGLVLYEMLAGKPAFERPSAVQTMSAIVEDDPPAMERPLPAQLRWILERCLAKDREGRYESTRDLARDLAQLRDRFGESVATATGIQPVRPASSSRRPKLAVIAAVCAAVVAWCAARLLENQERVDLSRYRLRPFATSLNFQSWPVWSHDGGSIAFFGAHETGPADVYVQAIDSPTAINVTGGSVAVYSPYPPFWSPDGRSIYFRCGKGGRDGLCRAPASGGEPDMLQPGALCATISPDGRTVAMLMPESNNPYQLHLMTATPPEATPREYEPRLWPPTVYYNNPSIQFSPDGAKILVAIALEGRGEMAYIVPWPRGQAHTLFPGGVPFSYTPQFAWMPDSRYAVFSGAGKIHMTDTGSGRYWPVMVEDRNVGAQSVSPDGLHMAYESRLSHADVIAVPLDEGPVRTLLGSFRSEQQADASHVAQQLVYVTDRRGVLEVWITSLAEGWDRPLFTPENFPVDGDPAQLFSTPVFSPDARRVAVTAKGKTSIHIYTAFVSGGAPVRLTTGNDIEVAPAWSPDGNWICFTRVMGNTLQLSKARVGSGEPPVDIGPANANPIPAWSPTGEWIAVYDTRGKLTLRSPDGKNSRELPGDGGPFAWSRDGKTLYSLSLNAPALSAIDIETGRERKLRDLPGRPFTIGNPGLRATLTSDGKSIVYTVNRPRTEIWILEGLQRPEPWYRRLLGY